MKRKSCLLAVLVLVFTLVFAPVSQTSAIKLIDEALLYFYGMNGIFHYNGETEKCTPGEGGNQNYAGEQVWSDAELLAIEENQAIYEEAASQYGFPWQILAVLHSMETGLRRYNPSNGQGVYQLYSYTGGGSNENRFEPADSISEEEFRRQTLIAAGIVSNMIGDSSDSDNIKRMFFKYNGVSSKYIERAIAMGYSRAEAENGAGSPYVMNRYDARRDPTSLEMDSAWAGRYVRDGEYDSGSTSTNYGSFTKYEALAGSSFCDDMSGDIVDTAMLLSWDGRGHDKNDPKPEYVKAMKEAGTYQSPCRSGGDCAPIGASCDMFVATVMRYSGSDPNFPIFGPAVQENYMRSHTDMYTQVNASDVSDLLPGDILVTTENGRHIYIYLGNGMQASASYNDRTGEHFQGVYLSDGGTGGGVRHYNVYRRIN
ncbi:MAG: hypothetical protein Q4A36_01445 [Candidatus Saccharibacteria bacterium]|nr:hypothetical protein [Candidatus Saccharibacteria bacterium]